MIDYNRGGDLVVKLCLILFTPWTVAHQAPLSVGFSWQEYWSGLPFPSPGDLPDSGTEPPSPESPAMTGRLFTAVPLEKPPGFECWLLTGK